MLLTQRVQLRAKILYTLVAENLKPSQKSPLFTVKLHFFPQKSIYVRKYCLKSSNLILKNRLFPTPQTDLVIFTSFSFAKNESSM